MKRVSVLVVLVSLMAAFFCGRASADEGLAIRLTADTEGHVGPCYSCPGEKGLGGLTRRASLVANMRDGDAPLLLLDAGNAIFGGDSLPSNGEVIVAAYNELGYDGVNLTHRDFFRGKEQTLQLIEQATFPFVSANVLDADSGQPLVRPFVVKEVGGERVAIVGATQRPAVLDMQGYVPAALAGLRDQLEGIDIRQPEEALAEWLPKAKAEADRVVLLYYGSGFGLRRIQQQFGDELDAICVGGIRPTHVPDDAQPPLIATTMHGRHVARATVTVADQRWQVDIEQVAVEPTLEPDQAMQELLAQYVTPPSEPVRVAAASHVAPPAVEPSDEAATPTEPAERKIPQPPPLVARSPTTDLLEEDKTDAVPVASDTPKDAPPADAQTVEKRSIAIEEDDRTGIELIADVEGREPPGIWKVYNANTGELVAQVGRSFIHGYRESRWGFTSLPPGHYRLSIVPDVAGAVEIAYADGIEIAQGQVATIEVDTGIKLVGSTDDAAPPGAWYVYDSETGDKVAQVGTGTLRVGAFRGSRWGLTPLPPGNYRVSILPSGAGAMEIVFADDIELSPSQIATIKVDSGVELMGRTDSAPPPGFWYVYDADTDEKVAQVGKSRLGGGYRGSRWGFTPLPPGSYEVATIYGGAPGRSDAFELQQGQVKRLTLGELGITEVRVELPAAKNVRLASGGAGLSVEIATQDKADVWKSAAAQDFDSFAHYLRASVGGKYEGLLRRCEIPEMLEYGRFQDRGFDDRSEYRGHQELPAGYWVYDHPHVFIWREEVGRGRSSIPVDHTTHPTHVSGWVSVADDAVAILRSGDLVLETPVTLVGEEINEVPFDAEALAKRHQLTWFQIVPQEVKRSIVMDEAGDRLLGVGEDPWKAAAWLAPAGAIVRLQDEAREALYDDLPTAEFTKLEFDEQRIVSAQQTAGKIQVDIAIQTPNNGDVVESDRVKVTGRASTTGPAGATRVAIVLDASNSTDGSSGADLDGDGEEESILQAEVAAARRLLEELQTVEASSPGTAFQVTVVRFANRGEVMAPLSPMSNPGALETLNAALDQIIQEGNRGATDVESAIQATLRLFTQAERPGPSSIVVMTDGIPMRRAGRGAIPAVLESFDASARAGLQGIDIHTLGLGEAFHGEVEAEVRFPPAPDNADGASIISIMAACGAPGSTFKPLPRPADVVEVVSQLPVIELPDAELKEVQVVNITTGEPAFSVKLDRNGFFEAEVPVSLVPLGENDANTLEATAIAKDERYRASDRVTVHGKKATVIPPDFDEKQPLVRRPPFDETSPFDPAGDSQVSEEEDEGEGEIFFPPDRIPAIQLVLDSSGSMLKDAGDEPKHVIAERVVRLLLDQLPDNTPVGLRLYGHMGFWTRPEQPRAGYPPRGDPRWFTDSQLVVPVGPLHARRRENLASWLDWAEPRGLTPLVHSLLEAQKDFSGAAQQGLKIIILVSDGKETCGGDLDDVEQALLDSDIVIHTIGFDLDDEDVFSRRALERIAQYGGGLYFTADTASELIRRLQMASVSVACEVLDADGDRVARIAQGGPPARLAPGSYTIRIIGSNHSPLPVQVEEDQPLRLRLTEDGTLDVLQEATP